MTIDIDYTLKITKERDRKSAIIGRDVEEETESNRGRIIQSPAVRRLQQKTQVFPLEINAAVRTRLTHSLEVQQTGRFLSREIIKLLEQDDLSTFKLENFKIAFVNIVEMACLMHDIGNPPFGHFGEIVINEWIQKNADDCLNKATLSNKEEIKKNHKALKKMLTRDIENFDGNAQSIRLVHTLQDLNLTYSQTAALIKYTRPAFEEKPKSESETSYLRKKPGYYFSEKDFVDRLNKSLLMDEYSRFPLAYIMEAADDISYSIADLEDGVAKKLMSLKKLKQVLIRTWRECDDDSKYFEDLIDRCYDKAREKPNLRASAFLISFRTELVKRFISHAANRYVKNHESIFNGTFNGSLLEGGDEINAILETLKKVARKYIFIHHEVETLELRGYSVITGLFNLYKPLLCVSSDEFKEITCGNSKLFCMVRLFNRLPKKNLHAYHVSISTIDNVDASKFSLFEWYHRVRLLIDYISGMTDEYAQSEYQTISAI